MKKTFRTAIVSATFIFAGLGFGTATAFPATFTVTNTANTNDFTCDSDCSLREAMYAAEASPGDNTILFDPVLFSVPQTIFVGGQELEFSGSGNLNIVGPGDSLLTINGGGQNRVFELTNTNGTVTLSGMKISNGASSGPGGGIIGFGNLTLANCTVSNNTSGPSGGSGGGVFVTGVGNTLTVNNCRIINNSVPALSNYSGGGIAVSAADLVVQNSTVSNNSAPNGAGGILISNSDGTISTSSVVSSNSGAAGGISAQFGTLSISFSTLSANISTGRGGAISTFESVLTVNEATIENNVGGTDGGGISIENTSHLANSITNTRLTGNSANHRGGGIYTIAPLNLTGCIVSDNSAPQGGGIVAFSDSMVANSTIGNNTATTSGGGIVSFGNLIITESVISENTVNSGIGGGIAQRSGGLRISKSTIRNNEAVSAGSTFARGGGIYIGDQSPISLIQDTTISSNLTSNSTPANSAGAGVYTESGLKIVNSTVTGNVTDGTGGGLVAFSTSPTALVNSTVVYNSGQMGGGVFFGPPGNVQAINSIVALNQATGSAPDVSGTITSFGNNLVGDDTGSLGWVASDFTNQTPTIAPLEYRGGITQIHAVYPNSPVFNGGNNCVLTDTCGVSIGFAIANDQRGSGFPRFGTVDIGAYEILNIVTSTDDFINAPGRLRTVIDAAAPNDFVFFSPSLFQTPTTITLTNGEIQIGKNLTILGPGADKLAISGGTSSRIFRVTSGNVIIEDVSMSEGRDLNGNGGCVSNSAVLIMRRVEIRECQAVQGGAVYNDVPGTITLDSSSIVWNSATNYGGGIYLQDGAAFLLNSTISGNQTFNFGGGGIFVAVGNLTVSHSTITNNHAPSGHGGGIINAIGNVFSRAALIAGNTALVGPDFHGDAISNGFNLVGDATGSTGFLDPSDQTGTSGSPINPYLNPLARTRGTTQTHAAMPPSPAINKIGTGYPATDQTGAARPFDGMAEIGAYELRSFVVTNDSDSGPGSLREAVATANANPGDDEIAFDMSFFNVPRSILLTSGEIRIENGGMLTIPGTGAGSLSISGNNASRVFYVVAGVDAVIRNLTLTGGSSSDSGGAVLNEASLRLENVEITNSTSSQNGGAVANLGTLTVVNSLISANSAANGGGIMNEGGTLRAVNSTFSGNQAVNDGGGIYDFAGGSMLTNVTVTANSASAGGGGVRNNGGSIMTRNSIYSGNSAPIGPDLSGNISSLGKNLLRNSAGSSGWNGSDILNQDPLLLTLSDNGGATKTHAFSAASPALNQGDICVTNLSCASGNPHEALLTDQRGAGFGRLRGSAVDIGAYELALLVVTNTNDTGPGSLRQAIADANTAPGDDVVTFDESVFANQQTIVLTSGELALGTNGELSILGTGANKLTVSGGNSSRVFANSANSKALLKGLRITAGNAAGTSPVGSGGGIANFGELTIEESAVHANAAGDGNGGGVYNEGILRIIRSTVSNNSSLDTTNGDGGGIYSLTGTLDITNSTISGNGAFNRGGGIWNGNGILELTNATVSNNSANAEGGGIYQDTGNYFSLKNTIAAGNSNGISPDVRGDAVSMGNNLLGVNQGSTGFPAGFPNGNGDRVGTIGSPLNPMLAALSNYGGTTETHALLAGSPAQDGGDNCVITGNCLVAKPLPSSLDSLLPISTDQRGFTRPQGFAVDIGAYEVLVPTAASVSVSGTVVIGKRFLSNGFVTAVDSQGQTKSARINSFGRYFIEGLVAGEVYTISVQSRGHRFNPQVVGVNSDIQDLNFEGELME